GICLHALSRGMARPAAAARRVVPAEELLRGVRAHLGPLDIPPAARGSPDGALLEGAPPPCTGQPPRDRRACEGSLMQAPATLGPLRGVLSGIASLGKGLWITLAYTFRPPITVQYPEQRVVLPLRFRGRLVMPIDPEKGTTRCTACMRCVRICPNHSIDIEKAVGPAGKVPLQPRHVHVLQPLRRGVPLLCAGDVRRARACHDGPGRARARPGGGEIPAHRQEGIVVAEEVPRRGAGGVGHGGDDPFLRPGRPPSAQRGSRRDRAEYLPCRSLPCPRAFRGRRA